LTVFECFSVFSVAIPGDPWRYSFPDFEKTGKTEKSTFLDLGVRGVTWRYLALRGAPWRYSFLDLAKNGKTEKSTFFLHSILEK
jgi:hypothetical protein